MACDVTQADLGPLFADVDADVASTFIEQATLIILGPTDSQAAAEAAYKACGVDPCNLIVLAAQHLLAMAPGSGAGTSATVTSERVGEVSTSYANTSSGSGFWVGSVFGSLVSAQLARFERCRARRRSFPFGVGPSGVQP